MTKRSWQRILILLGAYVTNLLDKWAIQQPSGSTVFAGGLGNPVVINQPRQIAVRVGYSF